MKPHKKEEEDPTDRCDDPLGLDYWGMAGGINVEAKTGDKTDTTEPRRNQFAFELWRTVVQQVVAASVATVRRYRNNQQTHNGLFS